MDAVFVIDQGLVSDALSNLALGTMNAYKSGVPVKWHDAELATMGAQQVIIKRFDYKDQFESCLRELAKNRLIPFLLAHSILLIVALDIGSFRR